jgi:squalene monooxygenase
MSHHFEVSFETAKNLVEVCEKNYDAIIVGSGIAGSALASALGKQERTVLLIERDVKEPGRNVYWRQFH